VAAGAVDVDVDEAGDRREMCGFYFFGAGVAVLILSDAFQFSWRYQLPALVTLPPAGALGLTVLLSYLRKPRQRDGAAEPANATKLTSPAV